MLTRHCLSVMEGHGLRYHIHTKSDLILRDLDLLSRMKGEVGVTLTGLDDRISKITEPGAPLPGKRLETLKTLTGEGIDTYALVGPVLKFLEGKEEEFVEAVAATGTKRMCLDRLNLRPLLSERLERMNITGSVSALEKIRVLAKDAGIEVSDVF